MAYGGISDPNYTITKTIYVSPTGSDSNDGLTRQAPRLRSTATLAMLGPGVGICCLDGTYVGGIAIRNGGNADSLTGYAVIFSDTPKGAKFVPDPNNAKFNLVDITAGSASYLVLDGLDIQGPLPSFTGGSCIESKYNHHHKILNCALHDAAACGLQTGAGFDYLLLKGCDISGNAGTGNGNIQGGGYSGVSLATPTAHDILSGYHFVIVDNHIHDNMEGPLITIPHSDGNGLVFDTWNLSGYSQAVLVDSNLITGNGARGILILNAYAGGFTLRNNTCDKNGQDPTKYGTRGEIAIWRTPNTIVANNIMVADPAFNANNVALLIVSDSNSTGLFNNLTFDGTAGQASYQTVSTTTQLTSANGNLIGVDPQFVNPPADLHLLTSSPALGVGTLAYGYSANDIAGNPRVVNNKIDIGAYEATGILPQTQAIINAYTTQPTQARITAIDTCVRALMVPVAGVKPWDVIDVLWMRSADLQSFGVEWKNPTAHHLVQHGTVTFAPDGGVTSDKTTGYFDSLWNPATAGGAYARDSSHIMVWIGNNPTVANGQDVTINSANFSAPSAQINSRTTGNILRGSVNDATAVNFSGATITDSSGLSVLTRTGQNVSNGYKNNVQTSVIDTTTSIGVPNGNLCVCGTPMYGLSNKMVSLIGAGGAFTPAIEAAVYAAFWNYMNTVGGVGTAPPPA